MFTMYHHVLAALALVVILTGSAHATGITDAKLFGRGQVFDPTFDLLGQSSTSTTAVQDVPHCYHYDLPFTGKRLIALDNDGVLIPMSGGRDDKVAAIALLQHLGRNEENEVWVVSARGLSSLQEYHNIPGVNLAAEHGTVLLPYGRREKSIFIDQIPEVREKLQHLSNEYPRFKMRIFPNQNSVAFAYDKTLLGGQEAQQMLEYVEAILPENLYLRQEHGKAYGEIKDRSVEKGNFLVKLIQSGRFGSGIAMGDQITDEGMFRAMNNHGFHSVIVSQVDHQQTYASLKLENVEQVHWLLRHYLS